MKLAVNYTIFAIIATVANIGSQDVFLRAYQAEYAITLSVLVGTLIGLVIKYVLDKKYIFRFVVKSKAHDSFTFVLYTGMGIITTLIFWGFEFGFEYLFANKWMRYTGGVIGLAIGYFIKYQLDKKYVFVERGV